MTRALYIISSVAVALLIGSPVGATSSRVPGNNGTLKVHEYGTPVNTENNDPHVCRFNFEGYGFDNGQDGVIVITEQGSTTRTEARRVAMPAAAESAQHDTYTATEYTTLPDGHYKSTLYGKDSHGSYSIDLKAKSKVFTVRCAKVAPAVASPTSPERGHTSSTRTTVPSSSVQSVAAATTASAALPATLPATGGNLPQALYNALCLAAGVATAVASRRSRLR